MTTAIWEAAAQLPSLRRFLDGVVRDLIEGRSVAVLLPPRADSSFVERHIYEDVYRRDYRVARVDAAAGLPRTPEALLACAGATALSGTSGTWGSGDFQALLAAPRCPEILLIEGVAALPVGERGGWLDLARSWAEAMKRGATAHPPCLCLIVPGTGALDSVPRNEVRLQVRWWWGFPSAVELRLLCRELDDEADAWTAWREALVAGLAAGDLALAADLWHACPRDMNELEDVLREAGASGNGDGRGPADPASGRTPRAARDPGTGAIGSEPPLRWRREWAEGEILGSAEYGTELHPSALAFAGESRRLAHRLWRGQAYLLLPLADRVRLGFCLELAAVLGRGWVAHAPVVPDDPDDRRRLELDPYDAELGYLVALVRALRPQRASERLLHWESTLGAAHRVRNEIAHYRPLDFVDFQVFWSALGLPGTTAA